MIANENSPRDQYGNLLYMEVEGEDYPDQPIDLTPAIDYLVVEQLDPTDECRHVVLVKAEDIDEFIAKCQELRQELRASPEPKGDQDADLPR